MSRQGLKIGESDHSSVHYTLAFGVSCRVPSSHCESEPTGFSALDVHGSDFESLTAELCSVNWEDITNHCHEHDCSDLVSKITEKVLEITEKHCKRKRGGNAKRADPMLKRLKKKQRNLNRKIRRAKREQAFIGVIEKYERRVAKVALEIRHYLNRRLSQEEQRAVNIIRENPKFFWSFANSKNSASSKGRWESHG